MTQSLLGPLEREWLEFINPQELTASGDNVAHQNCYAFSCTNDEASRTSREQLTVFLESAFVRYRERLSEVDRMWFYAWFDEQAGQLRLSACPAPSAQELPFGCSLNVVDEPGAIVDLFLASTTKEGISWSDLEPAQPADVEPARNAPYTLTVFARRLCDSA